MTKQGLVGKGKPKQQQPVLSESNSEVSFTVSTVAVGRKQEGPCANMPRCPFKSHLANPLPVSSLRCRQQSFRAVSRRIVSYLQLGERTAINALPKAFRFGNRERLESVRTHVNLGKGLPDPDDQNEKAVEARARVRSEVLAPFRLVRLVLYGFFSISASVALVIACTQLAAAVAKAPGALPLDGILQGIATDAGAIVVLLWLFRSDWKARQKQIARLTREERLGALQLELGNKKKVRMAQLRRFARPQVEASMAEAEPLKQQLEERGVFIVPLPVFGGASEETPTLSKEDLKFKGLPLRQSAWKRWFDDQMQLANAKADRGLYVSLRLDGRVRASGTGSPPWERFIRELPPSTGAWQNILDGMDGKVNAWK